MTEIFLNSTMAWCPKCQGTELARIVARDHGVFMERMCPHGVHSTRIAKSHAWYMERVVGATPTAKPKQPTPSKEGCPKDCGLCAWHSATILLPIFSITNDCNMDCPICFTYNRPDQKYYKPLADVVTIIDQVLARSENLQLVDLTGGEPSLHPDLPEIVQYIRSRGIPRVLVNTNGIRIARDPEFAQRLKDSGAHVVLSLDTFRKDRSMAIHGMDVVAIKRKALEVLEQLNIPTTILTVCIKNVNEEEVAEIVGTYIPKDFIRSVTIQNMTYTGQNGSLFEPREHITMDEVESVVARNPGFSEKDFISPASYHPLCYSQAYYLVHEGKALPFTLVLPPERLRALTEGRYYLTADQGIALEFLNGLNELWASGQNEDLLRGFRKLLIELQQAEQLGAGQRNALAERMVKVVCIHPHMDTDNFDIDRVNRCGDVVPDESGRMIPACSYNLLYRQKDERFWVEKHDA